MAQPTENVDPVFEIADSVLKQVFGEKTAQLIFSHLENRYALTRSEFSAKIDVFARGLERILQTNASTIERKILQAYCCSHGSVRGLELVHTAGTCDFATKMRIAMQT